MNMGTLWYGDNSTLGLMLAEAAAALAGNSQRAQDRIEQMAQAGSLSSRDVAGRTGSGALIRKAESEPDPVLSLVAIVCITLLPGRDSSSCRGCEQHFIPLLLLKNFQAFVLGAVVGYMACLFSILNMD